jgi:peptidyl-prolyl cis-trans isomerase C
MKLFALVAASAALLCAQAPLQLPITDLPPDTIVAKSNGKTITAGEIRKLLETGDPRLVNMAKLSPENFLGNIFVTRYLGAEGDKVHLADESPLKEQLQMIRDQLVGNALINRLRETFVVTEEGIEDFYAKNQSRYDQARIKVIAITFCPSLQQKMGTTDEDLKNAAKAALEAAHCTSAHSEEQAHDLAVGLVGRLRAGADFVKLVDQYSEDPDSKATAGDFGLVTREGSFKPEIKTAVFSLKDGEVSDPIKSGPTFYIITIKEKTVRPLASVREPIVQELKQKHFTDWMEEITKRFKPTIERPDFFTATAPKATGAPRLTPE